MSDGAAVIAFANARLDEDEAAARESCYEGQRWIAEEEGVYRWPEDELVHMADRKADARHIARHDPARVLRDVEADRRLLAQVDRIDADWNDTIMLAVKIRIAVWSDHPDYRAEWKP